MIAPPRLAACVLVLAACASAPEAPPRRATVPPLVEPTSYRIETILFETPLALAESLYYPALDDDTLAVLIDETRTFERLGELARTDPRVVRVERPDLHAAPGVAGRVPDRSADAVGPAGSLASDLVVLDVAATFSVDWAPVELEIAIDWRASDERSIARLPGSRTLLPKDHRMMIVCMPSRARNASGPAVRAVFGFVRAIALKDGEPLPERVF